MAKNDLSVREALVADGSLGHALYNPHMEAVHIANAARLTAIIKEYGWPGNCLFGEEGAWAAWLIAQPAVGKPPFMRHCLCLLKQAASDNDVTPWQVAFLEDRIRIYEGKPQIYGTQFQPNKNGELEAYSIENPEAVNERRLAVGLNTIEERAAELKAQGDRENILTPPDLDEQYRQWLYAVGWRVAN